MAQDEDVVVEVVDGMVPGDEAPPGTPGTGEDVCPKCNGSGEVDGETARTAEGTGRIGRAGSAGRRGGSRRA